MSYNKEYIFEDKELLSLSNPPLKDFVDEIWSHDVEETAIMINNHNIIRNLYWVEDPPQLTLSSYSVIRRPDDLYGSFVMTDIVHQEPAVIEITDNSLRSRTMLAYAVALKTEVQFKSNTFMTMAEGLAQDRELSGEGDLWCRKEKIPTLRRNWVESLHVTLKGNPYRHEHLVRLTASKFNDPILVPQLKYKERTTLNTVSSVVKRKVYQHSGLAVAKFRDLPVPLIRLHLIDFDPRTLPADDELELPQHHVSASGQEVIESMSTGDSFASVAWCLNNTLPREIALGFLGTYGLNNFARKQLEACLLNGTTLSEETVHGDRSFAEQFAKSTIWTNVRLSPYARLCVHSLNSTRQVVPVTKVAFRLPIMMNVVRLEELDATAKHKLAEAPPDTGHDSGSSEEEEEYYDPFEDFVSSEGPTIKLADVKMNLNLG